MNLLNYIEFMAFSDMLIFWIKSLFWLIFLSFYKLGKPSNGTKGERHSGRISLLNENNRCKSKGELLKCWYFMIGNLMHETPCSYLVGSGVDVRWLILQAMWLILGAWINDWYYHLASSKAATLSLCLA